MTERNALIPLSARRRKLAFSVALSAAVGGTLIFAVMPPLLPAMAVDFGGGSQGELSAQMALTMPSFGWLLGSGLSGFLLARFGMRLSILLSLAAIGLFGSWAAWMTGIAGLAATRFAAGCAAALLTTACMSLLATIYDEKSRPRMIGYFTAVSSGGTLPVAFLSGIIASATDWGWRASLMLYAIFGILAIALALIGTPAQSVATDKEDAAADGRLDISRLAPTLLLLFLLQIPMIMPVAQFPFILARLGVNDPQQLSLIMGGAAALMSIASIASGHLQSRFGGGPLLTAGLFLIAIGYGIVSAAPTWQVAALGNLVAMLGGALYLPQYFTLPIEQVGPGARAKAIGLAQAALYLSASCNPLVLAPVRGAFGLAGMYGAVALAALAGAIFGVVTLTRRRLAIAVQPPAFDQGARR